MVVFWTSLMVGYLPLVAARATTSMNHRQAARLAAESRSELRRDAARELIVEVLVTGREWVSNSELMIPVLGRFKQSDHLEFVETDSGKAMAVRNTRLTRALTEARMRIADVPLVKLIDTISRLHNQAPEKAMGPVVEASFSSAGRAPMEPILEALQYVRSVGLAFDELEREATPYLQIGLGPA